jgi:hypothetical protein
MDIFDHNPIAAFHTHCYFYGLNTKITKSHGFALEYSFLYLSSKLRHGYWRFNRLSGIVNHLYLERAVCGTRRSRGCEIDNQDALAD